MTDIAKELSKVSMASFHVADDVSSDENDDNETDKRCANPLSIQNAVAENKYGQ